MRREGWWSRPPRQRVRLLILARELRADTARASEIVGEFVNRVRADVDARVARATATLNHGAVANVAAADGLRSDQRSTDVAQPRAAAPGSAGDAAPAPAPGPPPAAPTGAGKIDAADLTVKGKRIDDEQRRNLEIVLQVGTEMGANQKVLEAAVSTVIQESVARNLDHGHLDSKGLFQQRPKMGWGTPAQVQDPRHAATKFFDRAIPTPRRIPTCRRRSSHSRCSAAATRMATRNGTRRPNGSSRTSGRDQRQASFAGPARRLYGVATAV